MKKQVTEIIKNALKEKNFRISEEEIENLIEIPPSIDMGDYAFPCFVLSKRLKENPSEIAMRLREKIGSPYETDFEDIQTQGPYINFFVNRKSLAKKVIREIKSQKERYGKIKTKDKKRTMVEFPSPNTNKPLHLGHLRNMSIGESISRILESQGNKIIRADLYNDRGIHICKSMLAYKKWGRNKTPSDKKVKPDYFVGDFYVMFEKKKTKKLEKEAQEMLKRWEEGDKEIIELWKKMNDWAIGGFKETYEKFGISHDVIFFENEVFDKGRDIVLEGIEKKIFKKARAGEIKINLENEKLGEKILLRKDGTSLYITQDMALAKIKFEKYNIDESIYVTGNEQDYHFHVLFSLMKKLGFQDKKMTHLSYGMVNLPEGKMKSREGTTVDADELIEKVKKIAERELSKRGKLSKKELRERSLKISLAAIKYMLLKVDIQKTMLFDPKESVSFEGNTGPYLLYSYARACSILKKVRKEKKFEIKELGDKEIGLIKKLSIFPEVIFRAERTMNPSLIANYSYQLAQIFNEFYHDCKVIGSKEESFRISLVQSFRQVLSNSLYLLGIETLEEM